MPDSKPARPVGNKMTPEELRAYGIKLVKKRHLSLDEAARRLKVKQTVVRGWIRQETKKKRPHRHDKEARFEAELLASNRAFWRDRIEEVNLGEIEVMRDSFTPITISVGGDAPKSVITMDNRLGHRFDHAYIAKGPRTENGGPRECVTEYLITCIGKMLPIRIATGRLVVFPGPADRPPDIRYMSRFFLDHDRGDAVVHALNLAATAFDMKEGEFVEAMPIAGKEWSFYTTSMVEEILQYTNGSHFESLIRGFAEMLAFDALVGANDRHAQNWGIIANVQEHKPPANAPIYDTARGLFWCWSDRDLRAWDAAGARRQHVQNYADGSESLIGVQGVSEKPNHFLLMEHLLLYGGRPVYREAAKRVFGAFRPTAASKMLQQRFGRILSPLRLEYIDMLLRYRHERLLSLLTK